MSLFGKKQTSKGVHLPQEGSPAKPADTPPPAARSVATDPPPAAHLEQALVENARQDNFESRRKVYQELLFSDLLLALAPATPPPAEEGASLEKTETPAAPPMNVAIMKGPQDIHFVAAFTSSVAAKRWQPQGGHYAGIRGQDLFKMIEKSPAEIIVLNPGNSPMAVISKAECKQLALGLIPQVAKSPVQIPVAPADPNAPQGTTSATPGQQSVQISFAKDAFSEEQQNYIFDFLKQKDPVLLGALGLISKDIHGLFLKIALDATTEQEAIQSLCAEIKASIQGNGDLFNNMRIDIGIMNDENFWDNLKKNNVPLFERMGT